MSSKKNNFKISAVQCPKCLAIVISRARHDGHYCPCKDVFIDGGREYTRIGFTDTMPYPVTIELVGGLTPAFLGADWAGMIGKFKCIRTNKIVYNELYRYTLNRQGKLYRYQKKI